MKKFTLILMLTILFSSTLFAQNDRNSGNSNPKEAIQDQKYKRVLIDKSIPNLFKKLDQAGVDLGCGVYHTDTQLQIELSEYELSRISENGITYSVLIDDMTKFYAERAARDMPEAQRQLQRDKIESALNKSASVKSVVLGNIGQRDDCSEISWSTPANFTIPSTFGGCLTYSGMVAELDKMRLLYPNLISVKANASPTNQTTVQGRTVYYVKISDNPGTNETEPQVLYTGMTHSREVSSLMNQIYFMWYVLENYNSDPFIKNLVDNTEMFFIPVANPDGLAWNETIAPSGGGMQRKNLKAGICDVGGTASTNNNRGVDINRNFGYYYGLSGSSTVACDATYRGTAAFSEPETQIMRDFVLSKNIKTALNHHAYSNLLPHPVNGNASTPTGRENEFFKFCHDMTQYNRYVYGPAPGILYAASGDASDWMCGGAADPTGSTGSGKNVLSVSPENGAASGEGGFWPSPTQIPVIARRAMRMNFINAYYAGKYAKLHDLTQSNVTTLSSNLTFGIERLGQTAATYTLTVTPVSSNIVSITSPAAQTGMTILEQRNVTAAMVLSPSIKPNQKIEYQVTLSNGDYTLYQANYVKIYQPTLLLDNNPDVDLLTKWTATGNAWVNATSTFTGTKSITDATGAYPNGLDNSTTAKSKILTTTSSFNLSGAQKILVQYYAKWDIERNFDLVQIQGSTNGTTWTTLCGNYTKPTSTTSTNPHATKASTNNFQNTAGGGGVVYDGDTMGKWVMEEIVVDASNNSFLVGATTAKFRFRLMSDTSNATDGYNTTFDGFYFDDFKVIKQISEPPVANCKNATLALNGSGSLTVLATDINNGSTDDIGIVSMSVSPNTFNCTHRNTAQTVTLTVTDADGQTSTCTSTVTIVDTTAPVPNVTTLPTITAQCSATLTPPTATDNCSGTITATTASPLTYNSQGTYQIYWTYTDASGNTANQFQTVVISDTTAPVANVTTLPTLTGQCSVTVTQTPTATDNCMGTISATTTDPLTYSIQGTYTILWTYIDNRGNQSFQSQTVIVDDTIAPVANVTSLPTATGQCSVTVTAPTATDACVGTITATTANPLTYNIQGTYTVTWTYNDGNGNTSTQTQTVVVNDTITPLPNLASLPTVTGQCSATVTAPKATDNCSGLITGTTPSPLTYNIQGTYTITWTYTDAKGNISTQNQTVIVNDTTAPVPNVTSLPTVTGQCSATVTAPTATDNCSGQITGTTASPLTYNTQGTYTITWTYTDAKGNTSTQNQTVIVNDTTAPVPTVTTLPTITVQCSTTLTAPTATDNCSGTITGTTANPLTYNTQGTYTVTWTYTDAKGNASTQNQTVVVNDTTAPIATLTTLPTVTGQCSATVTAPTATDNCSGQITGTTTSPLTYNSQGTYTITWTYTDAKGNSSTQNQTVVVNDTTAPVANVTSLPTVTGQCSATVTAPTATDNCSGQITGTTASPLTYTTQGTYTITWTYTDAKGNTSTQNQTVVVNDTTAPVANITSLPTITGDCSVTVTTPTATDNCSGQITGTTPSPITYNTQGTYIITWTYTDAHGNSSTQNQTVIVTNGGSVINFYQDADGDGFGNPNVFVQSCSQPVGYVSNNSDCNDNQIQYADLDGDGFGSTTQAACGVTNSSDCNDNQIQYADADGDGFGSTTQVACGVTNNIDCNDNQIQYSDLDGDGFGSTTQVACGVSNNSDCNDSQIQYQDNDNDGYGSKIQVACGVTNDIDCDDANPNLNILITFYQDTDGDGFGNPNATTQACTQPQGYVTNNMDCNDNNPNQNLPIQFYQDNDGDGFGNVNSFIYACSQPQGYVSNSSDCNDFAILYADNDGDGYGSTTISNCGVTNNTDCNDANPNQNILITFYQDTDGDGFGNANASTVACAQPQGYVTDNTDCNDNQIQYADADGDGFGSTTQVACGVTNNTDCNDANPNQNGLITFYQDTDGDGFGNPNATTQACSAPQGYVTNNMDCNDNNPNQNLPIQFYQDNDGDGFGNVNSFIYACSQPQGYVSNDIDCNDFAILYVDNDGDGYGSTTISNCGVTNNTDCNDANPNQNILITFYQDTDGDGFGNANASTIACAQPQGYVTDNTDCNDNQIQYADADGDGFGSTTQVACGVTNNTDCNDANPNQNGLITFYQDTDGDGFGNPNATTQACSAPQGYVTNNMDCNDNNPNQNLPIQFYQDNDGDGFGNVNSFIYACSQPQGYVSNDIDCNDFAILYVDNDGDGYGSTTISNCGVTNNTDCNDANPNQNVQITFYQDIDGDGFGNVNASILACSQPEGYVTNNTDCNDDQIQYADADGDGFGSTTQVACGVTNNEDCDDNQIQYVDADGDGFGSTTQVACGVADNTDCNDNQIQYADIDGDGFGSTNQVACGVNNSSDCNDEQIQFADVDGDGFGSTTQVACGVSDNSDCNDDQIQYLDADGDGFGSTTQVACGVTNNTDCNDANPNQNALLTFYQDTDGDGFGNPNAPIEACTQPEGYVTNGSDCNDDQIQYADADGDSYGSTTQVACGVTNNTDCNDANPNQNILIAFYQDNDGDGFGNPNATTQACAQPQGYVTNNTDCNDNQIQYADEDEDGFGSTTQVACGVSNSSDCNDNQIQYADNDGDGFGSTTQVACGVTNNSDCNDANPNQNGLITFYQDNDGDGFGNPNTTMEACAQPQGYVTNGSDCNDNQIQYADADGDGYGSTTQVACGVTNNIDCNDGNPNQNALNTYYQDADGDGFGNPNATTQACLQPQGYVTNNTDCNDNQVQFADNDGDGFGSNAQVACGVTNNIDCNDNQIQYADNDGDGFGSTTQAACGVTNNTDCNDANPNQNVLITFYQDTDGDGFGNPNATTQACTVPQGYVTNSSDCNDTQLLYADADGDGFGSSTIVACGVANNTDCNDANAAVYPVTLTTIDQNIYSNLVANAQSYRFRVTDLTTNQVQTIDKPLRVFKLTQLTNFAYSRTYLVEVAVKVNNVWSSFNRIEACSISTPVIYTHVQNSQCGTTVPTLGTTIYADLVTYATGYRFKVTNAANALDIRTIDRPIRDFKMSLLSGILNGTTYNVEVAVRNTDGNYLPYGPVCTITTPGSAAKTEETVNLEKLNATIYPNPFSDTFAIKLENGTEADVTISVFDLTGRQLESKKLSISEFNSVSLGRDYPSGVYTINLAQGDETKSIRVVKR